MFETIKTIDDLRAVIMSLTNKDYGDFKRRLVLYLNRYVEEHKLTADDRRIVAEMIDRIQFHGNADVERIRSWSVDQLARLKH